MITLNLDHLTKNVVVTHLKVLMEKRKIMYTASKDPAKQVVKVYSNRLGLGELGTGTGVSQYDWDDITQYFEEPVLNSPENSTVPNFQRYSKMYLRNFVLRTDNTRDSFCSLSTLDGVRYLKVQEILKDSLNNDIFLKGEHFEDVRSFFTVP